MIHLHVVTNLYLTFSLGHKHTFSGGENTVLKLDMIYTTLKLYE